MPSKRLQDEDDVPVAMILGVLKGEADSSVAIHAIIDQRPTHLTNLLHSPNFIWQLRYYSTSIAKLSYDIKICKWKLPVRVAFADRSLFLTKNKKFDHHCMTDNFLATTAQYY